MQNFQSKMSAWPFLAGIGSLPQDVVLRGENRMKNTQRILVRQSSSIAIPVDDQ